MEGFYPIVGSATVVTATLWGEKWKGSTLSWCQLHYGERSGRVLPYRGVSYTMGREVEGFYPIVVSATLWGEKWKGSTLSWCQLHYGERSGRARKILFSTVIMKLQG